MEVCSGPWKQPLVDILAVRECLGWFKQLHWDRVILEEGSKQVLGALSGTDSGWLTEVGGVILDCLDIGYTLQLQISFSRKATN